MWLPPGSSLEINGIFLALMERVSSGYFFTMPSGRIIDFLSSANFLTVSRRNEDVNLIFSAVQRLGGSGHLDFHDFLIGGDSSTRLVGKDAPGLKRELQVLHEEYLEEHGMGRKIKSFYNSYAVPTEKDLISGKVFFPPDYKTISTPFDRVLGLLLDHRNLLDHVGTYIPFHRPPTLGLTSFEIQAYRNKKVTVLSELTFEQFYEISRVSMERFWLGEYLKYLKEVGEAEVRRRVDEHKRFYNEIAESVDRSRRMSV